MNKLTDRLLSCAAALVAVGLFITGAIAVVTAGYAATLLGTLASWALGMLLMVLGGAMLALA